MEWYKERILDLIQEKKDEEPYKYWSENLFENNKISKIEKESEHVLKDMIAVIPTWERVWQTANLWSDAITLNHVRRGHFMSMMFFCLQYPRETALKQILEQLPTDNDEKKLCSFLLSKDSDYRHIRNSIAHGTFNLINNGSAIEFSDNYKNQKWSKQNLLMR